MIIGLVHRGRDGCDRRDTHKAEARDRRDRGDRRGRALSEALSNNPLKEGRHRHLAPPRLSLDPLCELIRARHAQNFVHRLPSLRLAGFRDINLLPEKVYMR